MECIWVRLRLRLQFLIFRSVLRRDATCSPNESMHVKYISVSLIIHFNSTFHQQYTFTLALLLFIMIADYSSSSNENKKTKTISHIIPFCGASIRTENERLCVCGVQCASCIIAISRVQWLERRFKMLKPIDIIRLYQTVNCTLSYSFAVCMCVVRLFSSLAFHTLWICYNLCNNIKIYNVRRLWMVF